MNTKTRIFSVRNSVLAFFAVLMLNGCGDNRYTQGWPYPEKVRSVYVEMFNSKSLRRGGEYTLTDAICKQIEVQTPYKIIADRNRADSVLYGEILSLGDSVLSTEAKTGVAVEKEARVELIFSWKDLNTGQMYVNEKRITAAADYAIGQEFEYGRDVAVNKAAIKVVESMRIEW